MSNIFAKSVKLTKFNNENKSTNSQNKTKKNKDRKIAKSISQTINNAIDMGTHIPHFTLAANVKCSKSLSTRSEIKCSRKSTNQTTLTDGREWMKKQKASLHLKPFTGKISNKRTSLLNAKQIDIAGDCCNNLLFEDKYKLNNKTDNKKEKCKCLLETTSSKAVIAVHESLENLELKEIIIKDNKVEVLQNNCVNDTNENMDDESKAKSLGLTGNLHESSVKNELIPSTKTITTIVRPTSLTASLSNNDTAIDLKTHLTLKSPKSPKTPNTTIPAQRHIHHCPNSKNSHTHTSSKTLLTTVPESKLTPKTPPVTPDSPSTYLEDDIDSVYSFISTTSGRSTMSCEHPYVARNGTTFSGRKMKYVVHCSSYAGQVGPDYLTPTQRAQRQVRRLRELLCIARQEVEFKDSEILRLTREVVELRLFKASLSSPDERSLSSDAVTVREAELKTSQDVSPIIDMVDDLTKSSPRHIPHQNQHHHNQQNDMHLSSEMQSSFADSGHFEDISVHSQATHDVACGNDEIIDENAAENYEKQRQELINSYEQRIEDLIKNHETASSELKHSYNDRVELLLQKLGDWNSRYAEIVPDYEHAKERIRELEIQLDNLQKKLAEHDQQQNKMYLHMYQKGQEAEKIARADKTMELAYREPNKVSLSELLNELQSTQNELENIREAELSKECGANNALLTAKEAISLWVLGARKTIYRRLLEAQKTRTRVDPEITLQFLKSAIYYFLTDKENSQGHLQAIESILEFTEAEKQNINKARSLK